MTQKIDAKELDVIVIGAGPAGGSVARELAKRGRKVLLIERSQEIGEPNYSTAGTSKETVDEFGLPEKILSATWDTFLFATPRVQASFKYPGGKGYVLDFAGLKRFLVEDAAYYGAEVMVGTNVSEFIEEGERFSGVRYHGSLGSGEARAKLIIDATGHNELANAKLKINPLSTEWLGNAMEYVMTNVPESLKTTLAFYFGSEYAYRGYSWIFPMNGNRDAKVGTSALGPMPKDKSLEDLQKKFINALPYFEKMEPIEIHAGAARADGGVKNHVYKNIVLIGDSAHQINPLLGEGIRHALFAGRLAAGIIDQWLSEKDANDGDLKRRYEAAWKKKFGTAWRLSNLAIKYAAGFNDKQWDETIEAIGKLSPDDFFRLISDYDPKVLLKYPSLAAKMIKIKLS